MDNIFCIECGFELPSTAKFCKKCGVEIEASESPSESKPLTPLPQNLYVQKKDYWFDGTDEVIVDIEIDADMMFEVISATEHYDPDIFPFEKEHTPYPELKADYSDAVVEEGSVEVKPIDNQFNDAIKKYRKKKDQDAVDDIINPYERRSEELNDSNDSN